MLLAVFLIPEQMYLGHSCPVLECCLKIDESNNSCDKCTEVTREVHQGNPEGKGGIPNKELRMTSLMAITQLATPTYSLF